MFKEPNVGLFTCAMAHSMYEPYHRRARPLGGLMSIKRAGLPALRLGRPVGSAMAAGCEATTGVAAGCGATTAAASAAPEGGCSFGCVIPGATTSGAPSPAVVATAAAAAVTAGVSTGGAPRTRAPGGAARCTTPLMQTGQDQSPSGTRASRGRRQ